MKIASSSKLILGLLCATSISASATVADKLVLIKDSDTTLTADYYDGSTLLGSDTETASPNNQWDFVTSVDFNWLGGNPGAPANWNVPWLPQPPPGESLLNNVFITVNPAGIQPLDVGVFSDFASGAQENIVNDGESHIIDGVTVVFWDPADGGSFPPVPSVPDPAPTGLLLAASTGALAVLKKHIRRS